MAPDSDYTVFPKRKLVVGIKPRRSQNGMLLAKRSVAKRSIRKGERGRGKLAQWARCVIVLNKPLPPISMPKKTDRRHCSERAGAEFGLHLNQPGTEFEPARRPIGHWPG